MNRTHSLSLFAVSLLLVLGSRPLAGEEFTYPIDVGVIDVTQSPWNFDNTGVEDVTAKFQELVDQTIPRKTVNSPEGYWPITLYFPDGTYRLTDTIVGAILNNGAALGGLAIQGQSRDGVILKLDDNATGYDNPAAPKILLDYFAGNGTNNAFKNQLENVTIDVGSGNPGVIGLRFHANNTGAVRNVKILSSDPQRAGRAGLEAIKNTNGPWLIKGLDVVGFDYGLNLANPDSGRHMVSVQNLVLEGQHEAGIRLNNFTVNVLNGSSLNAVPFLIDSSTTGMVNLIDVSLATPDNEPVDQPAILSGSPVFLRNVSGQSYAAMVSHNGQVLLNDLETGAEWHSRPRNFLWEETPDRSLNLPVEQAPEFSWPDEADWAVVESQTFDDDDTEAVRAAMASGKPFIIFKSQTYRISDTVRIPPHVRRISGQWATIRTESGLTGDGRPVFELGPSDYDAVLIEKISGRFDRQNNPNPLIRNASQTALVLRDIFWVSGPVYRSEPTRGKVFIENVHSLPGGQANPLDVAAYEFRGQDIWAYQWNPEMLFPHALVDGARFWAFGWKTGEMRGPIIDVRNHGYAELFGGSMNVTHDDLDISPRETVMLQSVDGNISANFTEHAQLTGGGAGWGRHQFVALETRNGERRELTNADPSVQHNTDVPPQIGAVVTLYTGYFDQDNPGNVAPEPSDPRANVDWTGYTYWFGATATDSDSYPAATPKVHWRVVSGPGIAAIDTHVGESTTITFDRAGRYEVEVSATDGALETSRVVPLQVLPKRYQARLGRSDVYRYVDNAPQDGQVNLFHPALLQLGDDALDAHSRLRFELDLSALAGSADRIQSAILQLRVDTVDGLESFDYSYASGSSFGVADAGDFTIDRIPVGSVSLVGKGAGDLVNIDLVPILSAALENGDSFVSVWLETDFTNDGTSQLVRFSSTVAGEVSQRPLFTVTFVEVPFKESAVNLGDGLLYHPSYGYFYDFGSWVFHYPLGWLYVGTPGITAELLYLYSFELGWLYTSDNLFPWVYRFNDAEWVKL